MNPLPPKRTALTAAGLRKKTARVARILEKALGFPVQTRNLPPPLAMLVATILSQNTNDKNSHRAYRALVERFPTWQSVAMAPLRSIRSTIRSGGMANQKSLRIKEILAAVHKTYGKYDLEPLRRLMDEEVVEQLTRLKGVGVKTASCVLLFSFGRDVFPVDTHVHRLCTRLGLAPGSTTPEHTFEVMKYVVPKGKAYSLHTNMIRFGRKVCRPNNPACHRCPLYAECVFRDRKAKRAGSRAASTADHNFMLLDNV